MATGYPGNTTGRKTADPKQDRPSFSHTRTSRPESANAESHTAKTRTASVKTSRRKARARKRNARIFACIGIAAVILSVLFAVTVFFTVDVIEVHGNTVYTSSEIIEKMGVQFGDNLLLMDKYQVIDRVLNSCVFIDSMEIRRVLPNKLVVRVTEVQMAVGFDCENGNYWLADPDGRLLQKVTELPDYSACISGIQLKNPRPGATFEALESEKQQPMETLLAALKKNDCYEAVSNIRIEKIYDIRLTYQERYEVIFGRSDQIDNGLAKLELVIAELENQGTFNATIDFSDGTIRVIP